MRGTLWPWIVVALACGLLLSWGCGGDDGATDTAATDTMNDTGDTTVTDTQDSEEPGDTAAEDTTTEDSTAEDTTQADTGTDAADTTDTAAGDVAPPNAPDDALAQVWVYAIAPPDASLARLQAIATGLGLAGEMSAHDTGVLLRDAAFGPVGPVVLQLPGFRFNMGNVRFFHPPTEPPLTASMTGSIDATGAVVIDAIDLPQVTYELPDGGVVMGTWVKTGAASAALDPVAGTASVSLPAKLVVSCSGDGCFAGTCEVALGTLTLDNSFQPGGLSNQILPAAIPLVGDFDEHVVANCTDAGTDAAAVATLLRLDGSFVFTRVTMDIQVTPNFAESAKTLWIESATGAITYTTPKGALITARTLPADATAETQAQAVLTATDITVPNALVEVRRIPVPGDDTGTMEREVQVHFTPRLEIGTSAVNGSVLAPIVHAKVVVRLGEAGAVLGLTSNWRPQGERQLVDAVPYLDAWAQIGDALLENNTSAQIVQRYGVVGRTQPQSHYDPIWMILDGDGNLMSVTAGTTFMPRLDVDGPDVNEAVDAPVTYTASATEGAPPYTFTWTSNVDGDLGDGETLSAMLSPGPHTIMLHVSDSRGAGYQVALGVQVNASEAAPTAPPAGPTMAPIAGETTMTRGGASFIVSSLPERVGPAIIMKDALGQYVGGTMMLQWRYKMKVNYLGTEYSIWSGGCKDGTGFDTCTFPSGIDPSFVWYDKDASLPLSRAGRAAVARGVYRDVPGNLSLVFAYAPGMFYAGPVATGVEMIGAWVVGLGTKLKARLGGAAPGWHPLITWAYAPPEGDRANACNTLAFISSQYESWVAGTGDPEDVGWTDLPSYDQIRQTDCPANDRNIPFTVTEFEVQVYSLTVPSPELTHYSTLIADTGLPFVKMAVLQSTDGGKDCTHQPGPWLGDAFCEIKPVAVEKTVNVARPDGSGDIDNYHAKGAPSPRWVVFPGCNDPTDRVGADSLPCMHLHERWFDRPTYSKNQTVDWHLLKSNLAELASEAQPRPETFVDGDILDAGRAGVKQVHILHSTATSAECGGGGVDNSGNPCHVFMSPVFGTH